MIQVFSQLLSAALGSVGFGLIFNLNRRYLPAAGVGGLLAWLAYLLAANTLHSVFLANLLAGFCAALYAEILARCCNAPSTPFFITAAIPLIPGSTLYYCMNAVVSNDLSAAEHFGEQTFLAALGIAGGAEHEYEKRKKSEKVQWGKDVCAAAGESVDELPEKVFISISEKLEDRMLENNGDLEYAVVQEVVNEFWEQEEEEDADCKPE